jgi:hypothetical protein
MNICAQLNGFLNPRYLTLATCLQNLDKEKRRLLVLALLLHVDHHLQKVSNVEV